MKNYKVMFDLTGFKDVEDQFVALHKKVQVVAYIEMGSFFELYFQDDTVTDKAWTDEVLELINKYGCY